MKIALKPWAVVLFAWLYMAIAPTLHADTRYRSKLGIDFSAFKPNENESLGWLTGINWGRYLGDSQVYWGLGVYFGTPSGKALTQEYLTFAGLELGWELASSKRTLFEFELLVGYGQGEKKNIGLKQNSYYLAKPGLAFGFKLGQGWKVLATGNYIHMSDAKDFSGPCIGLRLEFKSQSSSKFLND